MFQRRLIWQLYPSFLLIILISVVSIAIYGSQSLRKFHLDHVKQDLSSRAQLIKKQMSARLKDRNYSELDAFCKESGAESSTRITVIMLDGKVVADSDEEPYRMNDHSNRPEFIQTLKQGWGHSIRYSDTVKKKMMYYAIPIVQDGKINAVARTSVPVTSIEEALNSIYSKLFIAVLIIAVTIALISLVISKRITHPVERMTAVAKKFAAGDLDLRINIPKATEFAELAIALNEMACQLDHRIDTITEERSHIQAILSSMIEGVLAVDSDGIIVSINNAAANLLDIDPEKNKMLNVNEIIKEPKLRKYICDILENKQSSAEESRVMNIGQRHLQLYGSCLAEDQPNKCVAVLVMHDITRTRQLEDVRRDFVANVSHELKTPVTSIKGFVETLLDGAISKTEEAERFLRIIAKHSDRLNSIIDDLLSLSRLEESEKRSLSFEKAQIRPVLTSAVELSKLKSEEKNIDVKLNCPANLTGKINALLIEQAILNLVINAIKYSDAESEIYITAAKVGGSIMISVSDQGSGIAPEHLERIFERFYVVDKARTRKLGGTGLGLSIVKHIAQVHGGSIDVKSQVGKGTIFTLLLPTDGAKIISR
ncbi:MAG: HAMP domain-containing protein [Phycisphaerae bacterium]|nr:HAMP domain-containing protein [Phycisphaerae bacterium]